MDKLDKQSLLLIGVEMDMPSLMNLCKSSKRINELICQKPQIWIDKLWRDFGFRFLGLPSETRQPRKYYEILYSQPPNYKINYSEYSSSHYQGKQKFGKFYVNSIFESIKYGFLDLLKFLLAEFPGNIMCDMVYIAVENERVDIINYLIQNKKKKEKPGLSNKPCVQAMIKICIEKGNSQMLKIILENYKKGVIDSDSVKSAIEKQNLEILKLVAPRIGNKYYEYFSLILSIGNLDILKIFYNTEGSYEHEIVRIIQADNLDFFKYLVSVDKGLDFDRYYTLDKVRKYTSNIPEKELKYIVYYLLTSLESRATNILKYFFSFQGIYNYVIAEHKDYIKSNNLEGYLKQLKPEETGIWNTINNMLYGYY